MKINLFKLTICFIFLTVIVYSCRKDDVTTKADRISQVKEWYSTYTYNKNQAISIFKQPTSGKTISAGSGKGLDLPILPDWQNAISYKSGDSTITEVPVISTVKFGNAAGGKNIREDKERPGSFMRILFIATGKTSSAYFMEIIGDAAYVRNNPASLLKNTLKKKIADFSGIALFYQLDGSFLIGERYLNGQVNGLVKSAPRTKASTSAEIKQEYVGQECETWTLTRWATECYTTGLLTFCDEPYIIFQQEIEVCTNTGGGGGGGGGGGVGAAVQVVAVVFREEWKGEKSALFLSNPVTLTRQQLKI